MIPLGVLASRRPAGGGGDVVVTDLGESATSGATFTAPSGGSIVMLFGRGGGTMSTLSEVSHGSVAVDRASGRRAGAAIYYGASPGSAFTLTWTGVYAVRVLHVDATLTLDGTYSASPTPADGVFSASLSPASTAGQIVFASLGVNGGGSSTYDAPMTSYQSYDGINGFYLTGHAVAPASTWNPSGVIDPPQTNSAFTALVAAAFTLT